MRTEHTNIGKLFSFSKRKMSFAPDVAATILLRDYVWYYNNFYNYNFLKINFS
jgi:hypothetical protein